MLQADAYGGYNPVFAADRQTKPLTAAYCWAHARRKFFELADIDAVARKITKGKTDTVLSPLAIEAVRRIDEMFMIEREVNGQSVDKRLAVRGERTTSLLATRRIVLMSCCRGTGRRLLSMEPAVTKETPIVRLKVVLEGVSPSVMRRLEVPVTIKLDRLHMILQAAMGWTNSHLYELRFRDVGFGIPDPDWPDGPADARKVTLLDILEDTGAKSFKYLYDFGDGWEHSIKIERIEPALPGNTYPVLLDAVGDCPPEDCGGPWGYMEALETLADPKSEGHKELSEWWPEHFLSANDLMRRVSNLARPATRTQKKTS